jgi:hypothetical protein
VLTSLLDTLHLPAAQQSLADAGLEPGVTPGLGHIAALYNRSSTSYQLR